MVKLLSHWYCDSFDSGHFSYGGRSKSDQRPQAQSNQVMGNGPDQWSSAFPFTSSGTSEAGGLSPPGSSRLHRLAARERKKIASRWGKGPWPHSSVKHGRRLILKRKDGNVRGRGSGSTSCIFMFTLLLFCFLLSSLFQKKESYVFFQSAWAQEPGMDPGGLWARGTGGITK